MPTRALLVPVLVLAGLALAVPALGAPAVGGPGAKITASVDVDAQAVEKNGEPSVAFKATTVLAKDLKGKKITWTLYVKRKLSGWTSARNYPLGDTWVAQSLQPLADVKSSLLYATLAKDRFLPGEHEAAIVGTIDQGKVEVFREEVPFMLKATTFAPMSRKH